MLPSTTARVPIHTPARYNEAIRRQTEENVARYGRAGPEAFDERDVLTRRGANGS